MINSRARAYALFREAFNDPGAEFRDGQLEAILALVDDHARQLVVQRTGWGKSLVYFLATRLLREKGAGVTLIVSPLLSLMSDQMLMAERLGVRAEMMTSASYDQWPEIRYRLQKGQIDVLFVTPEHLAHESFRTKTLPALQGRIGLLVIDEAHCISDWGHDFRPDYRRIVNIVNNLPSTVPVLATTATANNRVVEDIKTQLGDDLVVSSGPLTRTSLKLQTLRLESQKERFAWLAQYVPTLAGSGIIYTLTTRDADVVANWLQSKGIEAKAYHAAVGGEGISSEVREKLRRDIEDELRQNKVKALVATIALGMGFDKPDLGFVIHFQRPGSVIAYYQQVGRAGRAIGSAVAILMDGEEDAQIHEWFIKSAFPTLPEQEAIVAALETEPGLSLRQLERRVNVKHTRLSNALKHLEVDGIVSKDGSNYSRTLNPFRPNIERADAISAMRRREVAQMEAFVDHPGCLMEFVARELDDPAAAPCGKCASCLGHVIMPIDVDPELVTEAARWLRKADDGIKPKKQYPAGILAPGAKQIPLTDQCERGRTLTVYGESDLGEQVRTGKYQTGRFSDDLLDAAVECITNRWQPTPRPTWITWVPSRRNMSLVPDLARRLGLRLGIPAVEALAKPQDTQPQKEMQNSAQQARNVIGAFSTVSGSVPPGPVLLIDDIVDSGWTFAAAGIELRHAGSGPVFPFALARMRSQPDEA